ncbi:MAG: GMC family oxidoreductase [Deltaproteobacteria bacterium]|nr:GMC family oxidoreductase [Deltaproteobacteria bacterium]
MLWGGWMTAPSQGYFQHRQARQAPWPFDPALLFAQLPAAERALGVREAALRPAFAALRAAGWPVQGKREATAPRLRRPLTAADLTRAVRTIHGAIALRVAVDVAGRVRGVEYVRGGRIQLFKARRVVLAASPVESARILHQSPRCPADGLGASLHDHLVAGAIAITPRRLQSPPRRKGEPSSRGAVILPCADDAVRATVELRGPAGLDEFDDEDLQALGFDRVQARRRSYFLVFAMAETDPRAGRSVSFDGDERDAWGRPLPVFHIGKPTAVEHATARALRRRVLGAARDLVGPDGIVHLIEDGSSPTGAGHESGTLAIGAPGTAVLSTCGEVHGVSGLYVADAAGLPGATDGHPSLTIACWSLHVAEAVTAGLSS